VAPRPRASAAALPVEHRRFTEKLARAENAQQFLALAGGLEDFDFTLSQEINSIGRIAFVEEIDPVLKALDLEMRQQGRFSFRREIAEKLIFEGINDKPDFLL
jgi:hypothetical protein